jgi:hypothetical protein
MTKKIMLLALAAVSAALFAMPAVASANWGVDPINQSFTGTSEAGTVGVFSSVNEPTTTCEGPDHMAGNWSDGTSGKFSLDATACHISFLGATVACKTAGAPLSNTELITGSFRNVTIEGGKRGVTFTFSETTIVCGGFATLKISGSVIGKLTGDPACGSVDSAVTLDFIVIGNVQAPLRSDSMSISESDDLKVATGSTSSTAALKSETTLNTVSNTTWTCNAP